MPRPATTPTDGLGRYLHALRSHPRMSHDEERRLAAGLQGAEGRHAAEALVTANLAFVVRTAAQCRNLGLSLEDRIAEGNLGLVEAAQHYDPGRGARFTTCAVWWIRRAIYRAAARSTAQIRLPHSQVRNLRRVREGVSRLAGSLGRAPLREEVSAALGVQVRGLEQILAVDRREVSLDAPAARDGDRTLGELLEDRGAARPDVALIRREERRRIRAALARLSTMERLVIRHRFGLHDGEAQTLKEIGQALGLSREGVRQIEARALAGMRRGMTRPGAVSGGRSSSRRPRCGRRASSAAAGAGRWRTA